jgi:signal recognition particle subunit SEC65
MMDHNPDRLSIWPGYFDAKTSRRSGRRVPRDSSVLKPDLDSLFYAARKVGLKKIKREEQISHPNRPYGKEGRLWVSRSGAKKIDWREQQGRDSPNDWCRMAPNAKRCQKY